MSPILYDVKTIERRIYCGLSMGCRDCSMTSKQRHCSMLQTPIGHSFRGICQLWIGGHSIYKSTLVLHLNNDIFLSKIWIGENWTWHSIQQPWQCMFDLTPWLVWQHDSQNVIQRDAMCQQPWQYTIDYEVGEHTPNLI